MNKTLLGKISFASLLLVMTSASFTFAQNDEKQVKKVNFRYSQNPKTRTASADAVKTPETVSNNQETNKSSEIETSTNENAEPLKASGSIAKKTFEVAKKSTLIAVSPTEIYKVGIGDVLFINLQNAPKSSTYYTVLNDGTIDFPLVNEMVSVSGMTTDEIEDLLKEKIKVIENPQVNVKVRDYASHTISVLGLVERAGERKIQREAIPLFVVRAEALVKSNATIATIRRVEGKTENVELKDKKADDVLIFAGDIIEFTGEKTEVKTPNSFYFIAGEINSGGQKEFHDGLTLTQAIIASGGLKKSNVKKVIVRRKNQEGLLVPLEYNLKLIKEGKNPDPILLIGDTIEIGM